MSANPFEWAMLGGMGVVVYYLWKDHQPPEKAKLISLPTTLGSPSSGTKKAEVKPENKPS